MSKKTAAIGAAAVAVLHAGAALSQSPAAVEEVQGQQVDVIRVREDMEQARRQLEESARVLATQVQFNPEDFENFENLENLENLNPQIYSLSLFGNQARIGAAIVDADDGALVTQVTPGRSADEAGLRVGDVIQSIDGVDLTEGEDSPREQVVARLREVEAGDTVELVVERGGRSIDIDVEAGQGMVNWLTSLAEPGRNTVRLYSRGDQGDGDGFVWTPDIDVDWDVDPLGGAYFRALGFASSPWGDMELVTMTEQLGRYFDTTEGLLVVSAPDDDAIDIQEGDVILSISGRTPNSPEHAIRILSSFEAGETIEFSLMRDGRRETVEYEMEASQFGRRNTPRIIRPLDAPVVPTPD